MESFLFKAKTTDAHALKTLVELLSHIIKVACFEINTEGIFLRMTDSHQRILIDSSLQKKNFNFFYFHKTEEKPSINMGINLSHLHKMMKSIKKRDSIELYINKTNGPLELCLKILPKTDERVTISTIKIQNIENISIELPNPYSHSILVNSNEFSKMIKDMLNISSILHIKAQKYFMKFYSDISSVFSREVILGNYEESAKESSSSNESHTYLYQETFDSEYLSKCLKISGLSTYLNLHFEHQMPLNISSKIGNVGEISLFLKSKRHLEEEKYLS